MPTDPLAALTQLGGVTEAVDVARAAVDGLLREPVLRRRRLAVTTEAVRRGAWASATLAGASRPLATFRPPFGGPDAQLCAAALRTTTQGHGLGAVWRHSPLQALARLHTLAAADFVAEAALGRPRDDPQVSQRLSQLAVVSTASDAPGVVVAAVAFGEVLAVQPFAWGNDLVARAMLRLVLIERGVDPDGLTVPEDGLRQLGPNVLRAALHDYESATSDGLAHWLQVVAGAVVRGASTGRQVCQDVAAP